VEAEGNIYGDGVAGCDCMSGSRRGEIAEGTPTDSSINR
jgi:hypothetical protein